MQAPLLAATPPTPAEQVAEVFASLGATGTINGGFRFSPDELSELRVVAAQVSQSIETKVSAQDIVRLGVALLLKDHDGYERGSAETSLIREYAERVKRHRARR